MTTTPKPDPNRSDRAPDAGDAPLRIDGSHNFWIYAADDDDLLMHIDAGPTAEAIEAALLALDVMRFHARAHVSVDGLSGSRKLLPEEALPWSREQQCSQGRTPVQLFLAWMAEGRAQS